MFKEYFERTTNRPWITSGLQTEWKVEEVEGVQYLSFQPSNETIDWYYNFDFLAKPYKEMEFTWYCHRGFLKVWKAVKNDINLKTDDKKPLIILGYSHGSGIAVLAHEWFNFNGYNPTTYGKME
jgi:hypothetical protein